MEKLNLYTLVMVAGILYLSCKGRPAAQMQPVPVTVSVVQVKSELPLYYDEYPGTVVALNQVVITPQVSGYVTGVHFNDGDHVEKGQLLYTLDQQQYKANVLQAEANYRAAMANLVMAEQDAERYRFLQENDAIARQIAEHSVAALKTAQMQVEAAKEMIRSVQTSLKYSSIYAPFSGTIGVSLVKPGASVSPGVTFLNTVSTDDPIAVDFNVDEKYIGRFSEMLHHPDLEDSVFSIVLPNGQTYSQTGRLLLLDRSVDPLSGTLRTRLSFDNQARLLKDGMNCTVRVRNTDKTPQLVVPGKSVVEQLGEYFVFVLQGDSVVQRKIQPGRSIGYNVIVNEGLSGNDTVVTDGTAKLRSGSRVSINAPNLPSH